MLRTSARSPPSWAATLPQKFSAATTAILPAPPCEPDDAGAPLRPQPLASATSASASAAPSRTGSPTRRGSIFIAGGRRGGGAHLRRRPPGGPHQTRLGPLKPPP